jgi:chromosome segregation ATPase
MAQEKILAVRVALTGVTDETRQIHELNDEIQKLSLRHRELSKEIADVGMATKEETAELQGNEQATRDLSEKKQQLTRTEKLASKEFTVAAGSMNELRAKTASLRNEANRLNLTTDEGRRKFAEINKQIKTNTAQIRDYDRGISGSSTLVGEYGRGIMNAFSKIGIAVAAAWAIIKQGEKVINSAQGASDQWEKAIGGLKNGLDELFKTLATGDF